MASPILPPRTPMVNPDFTIRPEWYRYFVSRKAQDDAIPSDIENMVVGLGNLPSPPQPSPDDAPMPSPPRWVEAVDPLTPPAVVIQADDLLYPPRYGA